MTAAQPRVLLLETIHDDAMAELAAAVEIVEAWALGERELIDCAHRGPIHAIVTRGKGRVTAELMDACAGLRAVVRCGVGLDNIDCDAAAQRGVRVMNLPGCNARTIAEHTVMLMLAVMRGLVECALAVRSGDWASRNQYDRDELAGKTVGIIGLGNIGGRVAAICSALAMEVIYTDPAKDDAAYRRVELDDLLKTADVITLHCQLDERSRGLMNADALGRMKPGAILINTARGGLVDHAAVAARIRSGELAGYGADVQEPPLAPPPAACGCGGKSEASGASGGALIGLPNVVITPHVGSLTRTTYRDICVQSVRNLLGVLIDR